MRSVLLVEADPITSEAWSAAIVAAGHWVLTVSGMREALLMIRDGGFDAVIIDAHEPGAGVMELAHGMNALPDAPPIILASESPAAPRMSVRIGAAAFVTKPCEPFEIVDAIERLIGRVQPVFLADDEPTVRLRALA